MTQLKSLLSGLLVIFMFSMIIDQLVHILRYFEGGISSVYFWDLDPGFAGVILIKKPGDGSNMIKGCWDSIHVVEIHVSNDLCHIIVQYMTFNIPTLFNKLGMNETYILSFFYRWNLIV